jgi:DNA polymerase epsilon subunit 3
MAATASPAKPSPSKSPKAVETKSVAAAADKDKDGQDVDLPKGAIKRVVKNKLASMVKENEKEVNLQKDALLAFTESAKVFISFLTCTANDICKEKKRNTISGDDVFAALEVLDLEDLIPPLKEALTGGPGTRHSVVGQLS